MLGVLSGTITTENFPQNYPSDSKCFYRIRVPQSFKIKIIFDEFDVEYDKKCRNDFMAITDKENQPWNCSFCQRLCGEKSEDIVIIKSDGTKEIMEKTNELVIDSNSIYVHLISDEEDEFQGFQIKYEAIYDPSVLNSSPQFSESTGLTQLNDKKLASCQHYCSKNPSQCPYDGKKHT